MNLLYIVNEIGQMFFTASENMYQSFSFEQPLCIGLIGKFWALWYIRTSPYLFDKMSLEPFQLSVTTKIKRLQAHLKIRVSTASYNQKETTSSLSQSIDKGMSEYTKVSGLYHFFFTIVTSYQIWTSTILGSSWHSLKGYATPNVYTMFFRFSNLKW